MQLLSICARLGAGISVLGAVLTISIEFTLLGTDPVLPQWLWLPLLLALIILGISAFACFRKLPLWLLGLHCGVNILGFLLQVGAALGFQLHYCYMSASCNPNATIGSWLFYGLGGFLLSGFGAFITLINTFIYWCITLKTKGRDVAQKRI